MNNYLYLDIETIRCQDEAVKAKLTANAKPPANYKSEEAIAKWRAEKAEDIIAKTSFDGGRGHVCCICWAYNDDDVQTVSIPTTGAKSLEADEAMLLSAFFTELDAYHSTTIVGHYVGGFDIRFLTQRAIVLGVKLPPANVLPRRPAPWSDAIFDTMTAWAGQRDTISMDDLADVLGIEGKGDFDGSMVAEAWANGEHARIAEYCRGDVGRTRAIHRRFMEAGW